MHLCTFSDIILIKVSLNARFMVHNPKTEITALMFDEVSIISSALILVVKYSNLQILSPHNTLTLGGPFFSRLCKYVHGANWLNPPSILGSYRGFLCVNQDI